MRHLAPEDAPAEPCPDANRLAGLAEGGLLPEERDAAVAHLAACEACRSIVAEIARDADGPRPRPIRWVWAGVAAAAAIVVAVVLLSLDEAEAVDTETQLESAATDLRERRPDLFATFRPLDAEERRGGRGPVQRGALVAIRPSGRILDTRPGFRWEAAPGAEPDAHRVTLFADDGSPLWEIMAAGEALDFPADRPALEPGRRYVWRVSGRGVLGEDVSERAFTVATRAERMRFEGAANEIRSHAPARIAALLLAHHAIRERLHGEAERLAREFLRAEPQDPVGRETLRHVLRILGSAEAEEGPKADEG